ncbi:SLIT and NTRK-like protein 2 [Cylas formicarius]|uniref:SLIT and NTRK-like protein 2 n=1 Tax=Cylas formicarius TaxID=197179 RepID=UPI0029584EA0|nr:SLIT and NTRK-like protein 2 [Cylas formicarius]
MARWIHIIPVLMFLQSTHLESEESCQTHLSVLKWPQITCTNVDSDYFQHFDRPLNRTHWIRCLNCTLNVIDEKTFRFPRNNVSILELPYSDINSLRKFAFSNFFLLKVLNLRGNAIDYLEPKCFSNLKRLLQLDLSSNFINILTNNIFSDLMNLDILNLNKNQIFYIQPYAFSGLINLKYLYLNNNDLKKLEDKIFAHLTNLKILYIEHNNIYEIHQNAFHNMRGLQYLYLNNNSISFLVQYNFRPLTSLIDLQLRFNHLREIQVSSFNGLKNLRYLYLGNNELSSVKPYGFIGLDSLQVLELTQNYFDLIDFTFFDKLEKLHVLWLSKNVIAEFRLPLKAEVQTSLRVIDLSFNNLTNLDFRLMYGKIPNIKEIFLAHNSFTCDSFINMFDYFTDRNITVCLTFNCSLSDIDSHVDDICVVEEVLNMTESYNITDFSIKSSSASAGYMCDPLFTCVSSVLLIFCWRV